MEQNNVELFFCDSSIIPVLRPIYIMLVVGKTYDQIQGKMQKEGTSLRDTYFAGAMGLVVAALEGKIKLVVNPVCFKELCLDGTKSKENIKFLFRSGLFHLAWPKDAYAFSRNSINRVNTINSKVGSLNRTRSVDPETIQKSVDHDFADKLSASQYEEFYLRGGVLLSLHGRTLDDLSEAVIEEFEIDTHKENNLSNGMRKQIEFKPTDSTF
ncbi:MAG: hypothetical protein MJ149_03175, partial [Clostridia bacterium]|nr:hypothetical protein [Clostridia bacterium]